MTLPLLFFYLISAFFMHFIYPVAYRAGLNFVMKRHEDGNAFYAELHYCDMRDKRYSPPHGHGQYIISPSAFAHFYSPITATIPFLLISRFDTDFR